MNEVRTAPSVLLATLASLQSRVRGLGGELAVINPTNPVRKAFRVTVKGPAEVRSLIQGRGEECIK